MVTTSLPLVKRRPAAVHALVVAALVGGALVAAFGGWSAMTGAVGRKADLTGRTEIWNIVLPIAPNPIGGAGFETFWVGPRVAEIANRVGGIEMTNEAHNGYIEAYLNLGCLGVSLIALILVQSYFKAIGAFRRDPALGGLLLAYVVTAATYNVTEAGFRMLNVEWFFLLLSVSVASHLVSVARVAPNSNPVLVGPDTPSGADRAFSKSRPIAARDETRAENWDRWYSRTEPVALEPRSADISN